MSPSLTQRDYKSQREDIAEPAFIAHSLRADGFDASEDGTGRGTPLLPTGAAVRRLTPVECARLQGFPEVTKYVTIRVCSDRQKASALAATISLRSPSVVSDALVLGTRLRGPVLSVGEPSRPSFLSGSKHARFSVHMSCEDGEVEIRNPDGSPLYVGNVVPSGKSHQVVTAADFARLAALTTSTLDRIILGGKGTLPLPSERFSAQQSGRSIVLLSGSEIAALAADVPAAIRTVSERFTSTMSGAGSSSLSLDSTLAILCSCVARAIASSIPEITSGATSYDFDLAIFETWLDGADGPQYRALGNAVTVPVIEWIGKRMMAVENPCHVDTQPLAATFPHRLQNAGAVNGVEDDGVE